MNLPNHRCLGVLLLLAGSAPAQVVLTGTSYLQDFNTLGTAAGEATLPPGWSVAANATTASLGTLATKAIRGTWTDPAGGPRNVASTSGLLGTESTAAQHALTNRALGFRPTGGVGDPGAAFVFHANTQGFEAFSLEFNFLTVDPEPLRTTAWSVQISVDGAAWTPVATTPASITDSALFGIQSITATALPELFNNQASVYLRIAALAASSGSGARDAVAIDDFQLTYAAAGAPVPEPAQTAAFVALVMLGLAMWRRRVAARPGHRVVPATPAPPA